MTKKPNKKTDKVEPVEIVAVIDRSGSMQTIKSDAIGGFNKFLEDQQKLPGKATMTLVQFDDQYEVICNGADIATVKPFTDKTYVPRGTTALFDAIAKAINSAKARGTDRKVMIVILTDGHENASKEHKRESLLALIKECQAAKWEFLYLAGGQDQMQSETYAHSFGINPAQVMAFAATGIGTQSAYKSASSVTRCYRMDKNTDKDED